MLYILSKILSEHRLKLDQMPIGLIDYNLRFFHAESAVKLEIEDYYQVCQETMMAHFGHKWIALNRGPMWQYDEDDCIPPILNKNMEAVGYAPVSNDISTLWSNLSSSEVCELLQHGVDPTEMDKRHGVTQQKGRQSQSSWYLQTRKGK